MLDIKYIRDNPDALDQALQKRGQPGAAKQILGLDKERRGIQTQLQELQQKRNDTSKKIGEMKRTGADATTLMEQVAHDKNLMAELEAEEKELAVELDKFLATIPNIPAPDVPEGKDEKGNVEQRRFKEPTRKNNSKEHFEIGENLGLMDFDTAALLSGARFTLLKGQLAKLERALGNFMLDMHTKEFGYTEISPPLLVREQIMFGTGQLPKFREDQFQVRDLTPDESRGIFLQLSLEEMVDKKNYFQTERYENGVRVVSYTEEGEKRFNHLYEQKGGLWLIPTAEVPLTNIVHDEIVDEAQLPMRFVAKTPCFRAEAGAAGKDTRGMLRQHQFYKVELVSITTPDQSEAEHQRMTEAAETVLKRLELPFRTMALCAGDMGFAARKTFDIEVWLPGQNTYREISSCSNCGDFQARRMKARFRKTGDKSPQFVHTLNGSGVAVGRCLIAILENYQQDDGSVAIPAALRPYMDGLEAIKP